MKKIYLKASALFLLLTSSLVWADTVSELQERLAKIDNLTADFAQTVNEVDGKKVQQGMGKIHIKRPNLFRMDTKSPQETQIVADGKTLWYYDPFVEQVTAYWADSAVNNTPFTLLTSNDKNNWKQYIVEQNADTFTLKPKVKNSNIRQFDIRIDSNGLLKGFSTIEQDGQSNLYVLSNINNAALSVDLFKFSVPKGVEFDDQRKKK